MSPINLILAGSYSVLIAAAIGIARLRKIHHSYRPFLLVIGASMIAEIASFLQISVFQTGNAITVNIFGLSEGLLWTWQFMRWNRKGNSGHYRLHVTVIIIVWFTENVILGRIDSFSSIYTLYFCLILVFMAINQVNRLIIEEKNNLFTEAKFLICMGIILFHTYRVFLECFYLFEMEESHVFLSNVFIILAIVNFLVNLLFAIATVWIPSRQKFTLPFF